MAVKTFTTGEVLTASDTNTYLANSGSVYITTASFSGASSVSVDNCWTSTFTNYQVVVNITSATSTAYMSYQNRASGSNANSSYSSVFQGMYLSAGSAYQNIAGSQAQSSAIVGSFDGASGSVGHIIFDVAAPNLAQYTSLHGTFSMTTGNTGMYGGYAAAVHYVNTAYTGFTLSVSSGTFTGSLVVMGYRKA